MRKVGLVALFALAQAALAHDVISTKLLWTQEISRIVYHHCASCHREGGSAMALMTYEDVRPWAKAIRDEVVSRRMPPWGPVKGVGEFRDDPSLSQIEIDMIVNWVEGGAPKGDDAYLPATPHFAREPKPPPERELVFRSGAPQVVPDDLTVVGIRPHRVDRGASFEVTAYKPDSTVERLIWIRHEPGGGERTYFFRQPMTLPKGTRIAVYANQVAEAIIVAPAPGS